MVGFLMAIIMEKSNHQRKLLVVSILHTKEDMGSLGNRLSAEDGYVAMVSKFWEEVKEKVKRYVNGFERVKIYQDGLPDTQENLVDKIINEVKSPNYELLRYLKEKGAKIFGTEDPKLLKEEYKFVKKLTSEVKTPRTVARQRPRLLRGEIKQASELLAQRDSYIAQRIDKTLNKSDLGILFLGATHQIQNKLPEDIQVEIL